MLNMLTLLLCANRRPALSAPVWWTSTQRRQPTANRTPSAAVTNTTASSTLGRRQTMPRFHSSWLTVRKIWYLHLILAGTVRKIWYLHLILAVTVRKIWYLLLILAGTVRKIWYLPLILAGTVRKIFFLHPILKFTPNFITKIYMSFLRCKLKFTNLLPGVYTRQFSYSVQLTLFICPFIYICPLPLFLFVCLCACACVHTYTGK